MIGLTIHPACRTLTSAQALAEALPSTTAISLDVNSTAGLEAAVASVDLVISLIPYTYHAAVIKAAIKGKTHVVTTSYVSPAMRELDAEAKKAGIVVMNEIGLDPGIDHLYAIKTIGEVHEKGGKVSRILSYLTLPNIRARIRLSTSSLTAVVSPPPKPLATLSVTNSPGHLAVSSSPSSTMPPTSPKASPTPSPAPNSCPLPSPTSSPQPMPSLGTPTEILRHSGSIITSLRLRLF